MKKQPVIREIWSSEDYLSAVGLHGVTEIVSVINDGDIKWFQVYRGDKLSHMVNASFVRTITFE